MFRRETLEAVQPTALAERVYPVLAIDNTTNTIPVLSIYSHLSGLMLPERYIRCVSARSELLRAEAVPQPSGQRNFQAIGLQPPATALDSSAATHALRAVDSSSCKSRATSAVCRRFVIGGMPRPLASGSGQPNPSNHRSLISILRRALRPRLHN